MRWSKRLLLLISVPLLVLGCESVRTSVDYDPAADFSSYRTFSWIEPEMNEEADLPTDPRLSPLLAQRVRDATERVLVEKGYRPESPGDMKVAIRIALQDRTQVHYLPSYDPFLWNYGRGYRYAPFYDRPMVSNYTAAIIAIDLFDSVSGRAIWHGQGSAIAREDVPPEQVNEMVRKVLAGFPPGRPAAIGASGTGKPVAAPTY